MVYHGYANGYRTLGRQVLLEPIEWTDDGWPAPAGGDLRAPIRDPVGPRGQAARHGRCPTTSEGVALGRPVGLLRARPPPSPTASTLGLDGLGSPARAPTGLTRPRWPSSPATTPTRSPCRWTARGSGRPRRPPAVLQRAPFPRHGLSTEADDHLLGGHPSHWPVPAPAVRSLDSASATIGTSSPSSIVRTGAPASGTGCGSRRPATTRTPPGHLLSLRPALFAAGSGSVRFRDFRYQALP